MIEALNFGLWPQMTSDWPQILHAVGKLELICAYQISFNSERKKIPVWFGLFWLEKWTCPSPLYHKKAPKLTYLFIDHSMEMNYSLIWKNKLHIHGHRIGVKINKNEKLGGSYKTQKWPRPPWDGGCKPNTCMACHKRDVLCLSLMIK